MPNLRLFLVPLLCSMLFLSACAGAQEVTQPEEQPAQRAEAQSDDNGLKPYDEVITDEAETDEGLFTVHRIGDELYYEIPDSVLNLEMLLVTRVARTAARVGYGGQEVNNQVVRWERNGDKVLLRVVSYESVADPEHPIYEAVRNANFEPIIFSFDVETEGEEGNTLVIEVTDLYTSDVPSLGLQQSRREAYGVRRLDGSRTYLSSANSYPENIEVRHVLTYEATRPPSNQATNSLSFEMNQSMILLPQDPMRPRYQDRRVGYFGFSHYDYSSPAQRAEQKQYISRWRLEPSDWEAFERGELVEPVEPIVYYIDPATPEKWRPYLKQGVEDWQEAFEAAGFRNAIIAKDPPSPEEDPEFSPEDIRYSVIRYFPSQIQNAYGPRNYDPRTGEILGADIGWYHNVMNLLRNWYFIQTSASNPEARGVEFDDEVMGELIRFVAAHEVGHTLGLPHNWGSAAAIPVDSLRSPTYTASNGTAASIMDYARFNYVAQPEDGVTNFMPAIGEYDRWSVMWGYRPIPEASTPEEERSILNEWILERAGDPHYFYGRTSSSSVDPRSQREALGDDAVQASYYGIENLKRIVPNLVDWTRRDGENYDQLQELYGQVLGQWSLYINHVTSIIGGVYENYKTYEQEGSVYEVVPAERQREAMAFMQEQFFSTPEWMLEADVLQRIEPAGALERIRQRQVGALNQVLQPQRLGRLIEAEALSDGEVYTAVELLSDMRRGIWSELESGEAIDAFRRNLQRGYLDRMQYLMEEDVSGSLPGFSTSTVSLAQSDIRAYVRGELMDLRDALEAAEGRTSDRTTVLHIRDAMARIDDILDA